MSPDTSFIGEGPDGAPQFRIGRHDVIPQPVFIPEIKGAEGFHAVLDHTAALESHNPVMVPAAAYEWLRTKPEIQERETEGGVEAGTADVATFETNHPLVYYEPPELYNYRRTARLVQYYFKGASDEKAQFETHLRNEEYDAALERLPQLLRPFVKANYDRVTAEVDGAPDPRSQRYEVDSPAEAWQTLDPTDCVGYFEDLAADATGRSAVVIPPVPLLKAGLDESLITGMCTANAAMADAALSGGTPGSYFHLYLNYKLLGTEGSEGGQHVLRILERELERKPYAGVALTIRNPHRIAQAGLQARTTTFVQRLVRVATEFDLPVISPRSEWIGSLLTDNGLAAYSDLLSGAWEYTANRDGGPSDLADQYGQLAVYEDATRLRVDPDDDDATGTIEYIQEGNLEPFANLPETPPGDLEDGETLQQQLGTPPKYRQQFAKPRKLSHVYEAKAFREKRQDGVTNPAREYLKESSNPYVEV